MANYKEFMNRELKIYKEKFPNKISDNMEKSIIEFMDIYAKQENLPLIASHKLNTIKFYLDSNKDEPKMLYLDIDYLEQIINTSDSCCELNKNVLELLKVFEKFDEIENYEELFVIVSKLINRKPLIPLTGEDSEWNEFNSNIVINCKQYQNNRCPSVYKKVFDDGSVICVDHDMFRYTEDGNVSFSCNFIIPDVAISFPYEPKPKRIFKVITKEFKYIDGDSREVTFIEGEIK